MAETLNLRGLNFPMSCDNMKWLLNEHQLGGPETTFKSIKAIYMDLMDKTGGLASLRQLLLSDLLGWLASGLFETAMLSLLFRPNPIDSISLDEIHLHEPAKILPFPPDISGSQSLHTPCNSILLRQTLIVTPIAEMLLSGTGIIDSLHEQSDASITL